MAKILANPEERLVRPLSQSSEGLRTRWLRDRHVEADLLVDVLSYFLVPIRLIIASRTQLSDICLLQLLTAL